MGREVREDKEIKEVRAREGKRKRGKVRKPSESERKCFKRRAREREKDLRKCEGISCESGADVCEKATDG